MKFSPGKIGYNKSEVVLETTNLFIPGKIGYDKVEFALETINLFIDVVEYIEFMISWAACSIRDITAEVGAAVLRAAVAEELAEGYHDVGTKELVSMSKVSSFLDLFDNQVKRRQNSFQRSVNRSMHQYYFRSFIHI